MSVKRVQSFEFYGTDALPKPARRRVGRGGLRVPMGEGTVKGGLPEPHHTAPCFPVTSHVNGGVMVSRLAGDAKGPRFESRSSRLGNLSFLKN